MTREDAVRSIMFSLEPRAAARYGDPAIRAAYPDGAKDLKDKAEHVLSSLESLGLAIVPVTATDAMLDEFIEHGFKADDYSYGLKPGNIHAAYAAMLAASPLRKTDGEGE